MADLGTIGTLNDGDEETIDLPAVQAVIAATRVVKGSVDWCSLESQQSRTTGTPILG